MMENEPHYIGHRRRLRKRFLSGGSSAMHDYELLELLLGYAIPRKDTKQLAKRLLERFESLGGVLSAPKGEIQEIKGVGEYSATLLGLMWETHIHCLSERITRRIPVTSVRNVVEFAQAKLGYLRYEAFMIIYLNTRNEILAHEVVHEGTIDHAHVYPRRVAEGALRRSAAGIILVHNHPSGHPRPSESDSHITRALAKAMYPLDIHILDHIIVSKDDYFSFAEKNLL